jgi:hypothetical protein
MKNHRTIANMGASPRRVLAIAFAVPMYCLSLSLRGSLRSIPSWRAATIFGETL